MKTYVWFFATLLLGFYNTGCKYNPGPNPGNIIVVRPASGDSVMGGMHNYQITWAGSNIAAQKTFEFSLDSGLTWTTIATTTVDGYLFNWNVPDTNAHAAMIRITDKNYATGTSGAFHIFISNPAGPGKTVAPKPGSIYLFRNIQTDSTGKEIDSSLYFSKDSVAETGIAYSGKSNVTHIISVDPATGNPLGNSYINFETNGDISIYAGGGVGFGVNLPPWRTYPVQSHIGTGIKIADTTISLQGITVPIKVYDTLLYAGSGMYSAGTSDIPVFDGKEILTYDATIVILPITSSTTTHQEFAPSLGYTVSTITDPTKSPIGLIPSQGGFKSTLVSYILK